MMCDPSYIRFVWKSRNQMNIFLFQLSKNVTANIKKQSTSLPYHYYNNYKQPFKPWTCLLSYSLLTTVLAI